MVPAWCRPELLLCFYIPFLSQFRFDRRLDDILSTRGFDAKGCCIYTGSSLLFLASVAIKANHHALMSRTCDSGCLSWWEGSVYDSVIKQARVAFGYLHLPLTSHAFLLRRGP
jgi:hypothetical protein